MSTISLIANSLFQPSVTQGVQNKFQKIQSEFRQLGQDLKAGNLKQAQQDFATLSQDLPISQPSATASPNAIARAFQVLGQDLQSGNLPAARRDFAAIQQDAQERAQSQLHGHQAQLHPVLTRQLGRSSRISVHCARPSEARSFFSAAGLHFFGICSAASLPGYFLQQPQHERSGR